MDVNNQFYIKHISMSGMWGDHSVEWYLTPDVNILGGTNGSGKTTLLRCACRVLVDGVIYDRRYFNVINHIKVDFTNGYSVEWSKTTYKKLKAMKKEVFFDLYDAKHPWLDEAPAEYTIYYGPDEQRILPNGKGQFPEAFNNEVRASFRYVNTFEYIVRDQSRQERTQTGLVPRTNLDLLIKQELDNRNQLFTTAVSDMISSAPNTSVGQKITANPTVANYYAFNDVLRQFMSDYDLDSMSNLTFKRGSKTFDYTGLSTGEKQLLLMLLMVSNTNRKPCVFFMDEPDLSMHIGWKRMLINGLKRLNPNMQLILSTQSPSVIEGWYDKVKEMGQILE